jgi:acetylornithine deacetylase/succinyl-diaminopimelate desuccinylase-like protein
MLRSILDRTIEDVWGGHDDFEQGGFPYVAFVIGCDLRDMEDDEYDGEECIEELADICINARRMMLEQGYNPDEEILRRLGDHDDKGTSALVEKYQSLYARRQGEANPPTCVLNHFTTVPGRSDTGTHPTPHGDDGSN